MTGDYCECGHVHGAHDDLPSGICMTPGCNCDRDTAFDTKPSPVDPDDTDSGQYMCSGIRPCRYTPCALLDGHAGPHRLADPAQATEPKRALHTCHLNDDECEACDPLDTTTIHTDAEIRVDESHTPRESTTTSACLRDVCMFEAGVLDERARIERIIEAWGPGDGTWLDLLAAIRQEGDDA